MQLSRLGGAFQCLDRSAKGDVAAHVAGLQPRDRGLLLARSVAAFSPSSFRVKYLDT
jgi:type II secretory pathway component PulM